MATSSVSRGEDHQAGLAAYQSGILAEHVQVERVGGHLLVTEPATKFEFKRSDHVTMVVVADRPAGWD